MLMTSLMKNTPTPPTLDSDVIYGWTLSTIFKNGFLNISWVQCFQQINTKTLTSNRIQTSTAAVDPRHLKVEVAN